MTGVNPLSEIRIPLSSGGRPDLLRSKQTNVGLIISYLGTGFSGFAFQKGRTTVAGELLRCMEICLGSAPKITVAGRTDAGVHARAQVVSFFVSEASPFDAERFVKSMNGLLDKRISVRAAWVAGDEFSARFSALWRSYRYRFRFGGTRDPFEEDICWRVKDVPDVSKMRDGSLFLLGEHDFSTFCRRDPSDRSLVRRVDDVVLDEVGGGLDLWITASSFCHQMVRSVTGLLYQVGLSRYPPPYVGAALQARDRSWAQFLVPASGLTLWEVGYPGGTLPEWS